MGSSIRVSIVFFLFLCVNLSFARTFFLDEHPSPSHSIASEPDPEQPDWALHRHPTTSHPMVAEPDHLAAYHEQMAKMWSSGHVLYAVPPKGNSIPPDSQLLSPEPPKGGSIPPGSQVLVEEPPSPDLVDDGSRWPYMESSGQILSPEPPKGGSVPTAFFYPYGFGSVAYFNMISRPPPKGDVFGEEPNPPPMGM